MHAQGEQCPVVDLLLEHFGEQLGVILLWEHTCFPMDDEIALEQAIRLVDQDIKKSVRSYTNYGVCGDRFRGFTCAQPFGHRDDVPHTGTRERKTTR